MEEHYLFINSQDSLAFFPNNTAHSFTIKLSGTLKLPGTWKCALVEMSYFPQSSGGGERADHIYLCSDLVQDSYGSDSMLPVLRRIPVPTTLNTEKTLTFPQNYYFPVSREEIQYVHIYLKDQKLQEPSFVAEPLTCTLHLVRVH